MPSIQTILKLNAASCLLFGAAFLAFPGMIAAFLGSPPAPGILMLVLGASLLANGAMLLLTARRAVPAAVMIAFFALGDGLWVLGTVVLLLTGLWINSPEGMAASLAVGLMVGLFGLLQFQYLCSRIMPRPAGS